MEKELAQLLSLQDSESKELFRLRELKKEAERSDAYKQMLEVGVHGIPSFLAAYPEYEKAAEKINELQERCEQRTKEIHALYRDKELRKEKERILASGLTEAEYRFHLAKKQFGYTSDYVAAGYILPNGKMLNFGRILGGSRVEDHVSIGTVFADPDISGTKAVIAFRNLGCIRCCTSGLELTIRPTREQMKTIRGFNKALGPIYIDISNKAGRCIWSSEQPVEHADEVIAAYFIRNEEEKDGEE